MKIDTVDFFYLAMTEIRDIGDGSQDALLVRVAADTGASGMRRALAGGAFRFRGAQGLP